MFNTSSISIILLFSLVVATASGQSIADQRHLTVLDFIPVETPIYNARGDQIPLTTFDDKSIQLYFTASWCGPCKKVTRLIKKNHATHSIGYDVIVISWESGDALVQYMQDKPNWYYVNFDSKLAKGLTKLAHLKRRVGIPTRINFYSTGQFCSMEDFYNMFPTKD